MEILFKQAWVEEIKANCECPEKFQLMDAAGAAFGIFFFVDGVRRLAKKESKVAPVAEIFFGTLMAWIHSQRFFFAPQFRKDGEKKSCAPVNIDTLTYGPNYELLKKQDTDTSDVQVPIDSIRIY